jgi:hypothetical protein
MLIFRPDRLPVSATGADLDLGNQPAHHLNKEHGFILPLFSGRPKTAICCVSEKIQTAYVCSIHRASWIFSIPCISPFWNDL